MEGPDIQLQGGDPKGSKRSSSGGVRVESSVGINQQMEGISDLRSKPGTRTDRTSGATGTEPESTKCSQTTYLHPFPTCPLSAHTSRPSVPRTFHVCLAWTSPSPAVVLADRPRLPSRADRAPSTSLVSPLPLDPREVRRGGVPRGHRAPHRSASGREERPRSRPPADRRHRGCTDATTSATPTSPHSHAVPRDGWARRRMYGSGARGGKGPVRSRPPGRLGLPHPPRPRPRPASDPHPPRDPRPALRPAGGMLGRTPPQGPGVPATTVREDAVGPETPHRLIRSRQEGPDTRAGVRRREERRDAEPQRL